MSETIGQLADVDTMYRSRLELLEKKLISREDIDGEIEDLRCGAQFQLDLMKRIEDHSMFIKSGSDQFVNTMTILYTLMAVKAHLDGNENLSEKYITQGKLYDAGMIPRYMVP